MAEETGKTLDLNEKDGQQIIELLVQAEGLLRAELKQHCHQGRSLDLQFLLEAQLNVSRALEALYDRASCNYTF
jgi:ribosome-binding factor A